VERKEADAKRTKEDEAIQKIIDKSKIGDSGCNGRYSGTFHGMMTLQTELHSRDYLWSSTLQFTGMNVEKMMEQMKPEALKRIQSSLVLEAIAKEENIEVSDEEVEEELKKMAEMYGMES